MEWTVSNMHYFYYPWEYFLEKQQALGAKTIDFYGAMPHIYVDHYTYHGCKKIRKSIADQGMELVLFTPKPYNYCLHAPDGFHGELSEHYYQNCINAAKEMGAKRVSISLTGGYLDCPREQLYEAAQKRLYRLGCLASELGIQLLLETSKDSESPLLSSLTELKALLASLGSDTFSVLLNMQAVQKSGEQLCQWMSAFGRRIEYLRFHNQIDWKALSSIEYQGLWGVCVSDDEYWEEPAAIERMLLGTC